MRQSHHVYSAPSSMEPHTSDEAISCIYSQAPLESVAMDILGPFETHTRRQPIRLSHYMSFFKGRARDPDDQDYCRSCRCRLFRELGIPVRYTNASIDRQRTSICCQVLHVSIFISWQEQFHCNGIPHIGQKTGRKI